MFAELLRLPAAPAHCPMRVHIPSRVGRENLPLQGSLSQSPRFWGSFLDESYLGMSAISPPRRRPAHYNRFCWVGCGAVVDRETVGPGILALLLDCQVAGPIFPIRWAHLFFLSRRIIFFLPSDIYAMWYFISVIVIIFFQDDFVYFMINIFFYFMTPFQLLPVPPEDILRLTPDDRMTDSLTVYWPVTDIFWLTFCDRFWLQTTRWHRQDLIRWASVEIDCSASARRPPLL